MRTQSTRRGFAALPTNSDGRTKAGEGSPAPAQDASAFTARLTVDITPELRGRIKIAAFRRGVTVADMLRELLACEFPQTDGGLP